MIESSEQIRAGIDAAWLEEGRALVAREQDMDRARDTLAWEMGDWVADREVGYGDLTRLAVDLDISLGTLKNRASVARRIDPARRRDDLSWSHHAEIAGLEPVEGDAALAEAALYSWSVDRLRGALGERRAAARAAREIARLEAENEALRASQTDPDEARRVLDGVRGEIKIGIELIEEGYRRILAATQSGRLDAAAKGLHGNARNRLLPSLEVLIGRASERAAPIIDEIEVALSRLDGGANRHDAVTDDPPAGPPPEDHPDRIMGAGP